MNYRNFSRHTILRCQLVLTAIRHNHRPRTDGAVKHFGQAFLTGGVQAAEHFLCFTCEINGFRFFAERFRFLNQNIGVLGSPVGVQEISGKVQNFLAAPFHDQTSGVGDNRYLGNLQIFGVAHLNKMIDILCRDDNRHTFLGFRDRQFGSVKAFIFLRHLIQINIQTVCQLADGYRYAARAKVVAALDHTSQITVSK